VGGDGLTGDFDAEDRGERAESELVLPRKPWAEGGAVKSIEARPRFSHECDAGEKRVRRVRT